MGVIGIGIDHGAVRAVFVRRKEIVWKDQVPWDSGASLAEAIASLLSRAPLRRWRRTPVHVAVGAFSTQVKLLSGLPAIDDAGALAAVVREGAASFFLRNGKELVTTGVQTAGEGRVWAAAFELPTIDAIRTGCRARRVKLRSIAPTAVVLPRVARNERFAWRDGPVSLEIGRSGAALEAVRRVPTDLLPSEERLLDPIEPVASLGPDGACYADAYGATLVDVRTPLALGADGQRPLSVSAPERRLKWAACVGCVALAAFILSPLGSEWAAYRARATLELRRSGEAWRAMVASASRLERVSAVLDEIETFVATRPERTRLLGELAGALPDRSAILRIQLSGSKGMLEVVTPHAAAMVESLRSLTSLASVEVVAQGARQYAGGLELERVMVRFRTADAPGATDSTTSDETP
ncbi:MAG TPA: hypothetical protein VF188_16895 [Longimicrobiales bacterium]